MRPLRFPAAPLLALQLAAGCSPAADPAGASGERRADASAAEPRPAEQEGPRLVLAFGDSLYAGFGLEPSQAFPAALQRELAEQGLAAKVVNAGLSGDTTAGGLRRLPGTLDRLGAKPDLAIVGLGANDALRGFDPAQTKRNLEGILAELKRRDIPVLLTGITAPDGFQHPYFDRYDGIYADLARAHGAELEPSLLEGVLTRPELLLDGLHPNAAGAQVMAERVAPLAARSLKRTEAEEAAAAR